MAQHLERFPFHQSTVNNGGTAVLTGSAADFEMDGGATFINTGTFVAQNNLSIHDSQGTGALLANNATFYPGIPAREHFTMRMPLITPAPFRAQTGTSPFRVGERVRRLRG